MNARGTILQDQTPIDDNPYRRDTAVTAGAGPERNEMTAGLRGLDGDMLDSILKTRMVEGERRGRQEAMQESISRFEAIWDQGYRQGTENGAQAAVDNLRAHAAPNILAALEAIKASSARTSSAFVGDRLELACVQLEQIASPFGIAIPEQLATFPGNPQVVNLDD